MARVIPIHRWQNRGPEGWGLRVTGLEPRSSDKVPMWHHYIMASLGQAVALAASASLGLFKS